MMCAVATPTAASASARFRAASTARAARLASDASRPRAVVARTDARRVAPHASSRDDAPGDQCVAEAHVAPVKYRLRAEARLRLRAEGATCVAAGVGSLAMGLWARHPVALAPGMGINAYFAYGVVIGMGVPWETALGAVFLSGLIFLALTATGVRADEAGAAVRRAGGLDTG